MIKQRNSGSVLWDKAKSIIPGGNQLLSKRSERFLPGIWPAYYSRCKGCEVWDLDGNHYYDFAQMGVGSCVLGYAHPEVNERVQRAVADGSMCSLNCREEVELAERLIALHPWAEMARFTRSGGEACAVAIRIARAATGKSKIAFCGYHGWHDWYLAANISSSENLNEQLLVGLEPNGVPTQLRGTALPFRFNNLAELEEIISREGSELAGIMMEPERGIPPVPGFLESIRDIATKNGIPLIFDEITSGFRMNLGGIHLTKNVEPDIAVFGKALGNGFPIDAVIGKRSIMDAAQDSFISSTFWTERIGFVAALATLDVFERENVPQALIQHGENIRTAWRKAARANNLAIEISGIPPLSHLSFKSELAMELQTLYAQLMLHRGYLLGAAVYTCAAYTDTIIARFANDTNEVFFELAAALASESVSESLEGEVMNTGFKRLN